MCAAVFRHRSVLPVNYNAPVIQAGGYIAPSASVTGNVTVSSGASVWYGAVVRGVLSVLWLQHTSQTQLACTQRASAQGCLPISADQWPACFRRQQLVHSRAHSRRGHAGDSHKVTIGPNSNLQDGVTVLPGDGQVAGHAHGTEIGHNVTVGHGATILGGTLEDETLVGMGATLLSGVKVCKSLSRRSVLAGSALGGCARAAVMCAALPRSSQAGPCSGGATARGEGKLLLLCRWKKDPWWLRAPSCLLAQSSPQASSGQAPLRCTCETSSPMRPPT